MPPPTSPPTVLRSSHAAGRGRLLRLATMALVAISASLMGHAAGGTGGRLTILVHASPESVSQLEHLGVRLDRVRTTVQRDLQRALGTTVTVGVVKTTVDFDARTRASKLDVARRHGLLTAAARVERLRGQLVRRGFITSPELVAAEAVLGPAAAAADRELARRRDLAGMGCGSFGVALAGGPSFGGRSLPGESWATVYTGALALVFPSAADLHKGSATGLDYSAPAFDRFRAGYSAARRTALAARALASAIEEQVGRLLGLESTGGRLTDPMRGRLDLQQAEHFARGTGPLRFDATERGVMVRRASAEVSRCA